MTIHHGAIFIRFLYEPPETGALLDSKFATDILWFLVIGRDTVLLIAVYQTSLDNIRRSEGNNKFGLGHLKVLFCGQN